MLAVKAYPQSYIDACRSALAEQLRTYERLAGEAEPAAVTAFEPHYVNTLIVFLDSLFVHRTRAVEGKDGNPLNEVRMLAASVLQHGAVLALDKTIRYSPTTSVLGLAIGDSIAIDLAGFRTLADAYFAELETRFTE